MTFNLERRLVDFAVKTRTGVRFAGLQNRLGPCFELRAVRRRAPCGVRRAPDRCPGSRRERARRGSPRGTARCGRRAGRAGAGRRAAARRPVGVALEAGVPPHRLARLARRGRSDRARRAPGVRSAAASGSSSARSAARRPNTKHSDSEFDASRLAPCRPVQAHSPTAYRPGDAGAAVEVGHDPAHHVVAGGGDRDELGGRVEPGLAQRGDDVREARRVDVAHVEADRRWSSCSRSVRKIARATASRGASSSTKRSPWASCSVAPSPRIASVIRKPSRPLMPTTAVGWNWANSRSASAAPAARASSRPEPNDPGGLVVRDHSAAAPPVARIVPRASQRAAVLEPDAGDAAVADQARGAGALEHLDRGLLGDVGRELAQDPPAGRAAAGVHDAAGAVAALEAERDVAVAVGVEPHAERLEVAEAGGRLVGEHLRRRSGGRARGRPRACPRRWRSGESSTASAAASPPCAQ